MYFGTMLINCLDILTESVQVLKCKLLTKIRKVTQDFIPGVG